MKRFLVETKFILLFAMLLTLVTVLSNLDFETGRQVEVKPEELLRNATYVKAPRVTDRSPASIPKAESFVLEQQFFCKNKGIHPQLQFAKVQDQRVLINFKLCQNLKSVQHVSLENHTNGFKAQVFKLESENFKTDYVQLSVGKNKIKIDVVLKDGQKKTEWLEILSGS